MIPLYITAATRTTYIDLVHRLGISYHNAEIIT
jgi:hypothetical protein